jgi:hypothetical protein
VKVGEGKSAVHVNRLEKVHGKMSMLMQTQQRAPTKEMNKLKSKKLQADRTPFRSTVNMSADCVAAATRVREQTIQENVEGDLLESRPVHDSPSDPDWAPDTRYLKKKLSSVREMTSTPTDGVPYALRSMTAKGQPEERDVSSGPN